jgi:Leu/Phe-tRNA-protein transferase
MTKTRGNWIIEALEPFEDTVNGQEVRVKTKERRIVPPNLLYKKRGMARPVKEHTYELKMEKKLKHLIEEKEKET